MTDGDRHSQPSQPIDWAAFDAVLFDLDGVLTPTAEIHERAWKQMFDDFLAGRDDPQPPFTADDYLRFVDGKPRFDGVRSFVASRGIELPEGGLDDPPGVGSICALGNRKNALFTEIIESDGIDPFPGAVAVLDLLERLGVEMAVVSSSRNAPAVLAASGLAPRFEVVIDGGVAAERGLRGKPGPEMYLAAASDLGRSPARCAVVEDALSGVAAGRAGAFALVLGIDRGAGVDALVAHGADLVVDDLGATLGTGTGR